MHPLRRRCGLSCLLIWHPGDFFVSSSMLDMGPPSRTISSTTNAQYDERVLHTPTPAQLYGRLLASSSAKELHCTSLHTARKPTQLQGQSTRTSPRPSTSIWISELLREAADTSYSWRSAKKLGGRQLRGLGAGRSGDCRRIASWPGFGRGRCGAGDQQACTPSIQADRLITLQLAR